jgi:hypothetical protein
MSSMAAGVPFEEVPLFARGRSGFSVVLLVGLAMPLLLVSRLLAPAGCLHFDYIREVGTMEGLIQIFSEGYHRAGVGFSEKALSGLVGE